MVKGTNAKGEESHYIYNGLGYLVANEWVIEKNAYGYTNVNVSPSVRVDGLVVCDRHANATGQGHINPTGKGHTTGGTTGGALPAISGQQAVVHKDYVLDYTDPLKRVIMETEGGAGNLAYRYVYGLEKVEAVITGIGGGAGSIMTLSNPDAGVVEYVVNEVGELEFVSETSFYLSEIMETYDYNAGEGINLLSTGTDIVKLYYHHNRLGSTDYITDNVAGKVVSYVTYDDWGALTAKAVLKTGVRELDLVQNYTGHDYDMVLGLYFAQARMYDAQDRRFMAMDVVKGAVAQPATLTQYVYVLDNPLKWVDPSGRYYIKQIKENGKPDQYQAVKESWLAGWGKAFVAAFDPTGGMGKIIVAAAEAGANYIGGNSLTDIGLTDITGDMLGSAIDDSIEVTLKKIAPKAVPYVNALFTVKDFLVEFSAYYDRAKTDEIIFKLLEMCNREIKSTDIITVVKRMGYAYQFVDDFAWYFYGRVWTQKVTTSFLGALRISYNYGPTYWEMDLQINNPGWFSSSDGRINGYVNGYYNVLFCHYNTTWQLPSGYSTLKAWTDDYTNALRTYLDDWSDRLNFIKEAFLAYIDQ